MRVDNGQLKCKVPIGFMRKCGKLVIWRAVKTGHSEPVLTLAWESPSNSRKPFVIQSVLFVPFPGIHLREVVRLFGGLPHHLSGLVRNDREFGFAMTGNSMARQIPICRTAERYRAGQVGNENRPRSSRLGRPPCGQIPIVHCQLSIHDWR